MVAWIEIDGQHGEGGGQVLRTAISLSAVTGKPCHVINIRARRRNPGLAAQHLAGIKAAAQLCGARLEGARIGSQEVRFQPAGIKRGNYQICVGTAGAVTLVLQTLVPIALRADGETTLDIEGGTDVAWSPLIDYFVNIHCTCLRELGAELEVQTLQRGFYPRGGGRVRVRIQPLTGAFDPIHLTKRGSIQAIEIWDIASDTLRRARVAERQLDGFRSAWRDEYPLGQVHQLYVDSPSPGTSFHAFAHTETSRLGACAVGRRGKRAELVGKEAADLLIGELAGGAAVDRWMADQLIPYLGLFGGSIHTSYITEHIRTNIWTTEQFLPLRFTIKRRTIRAG